MNTEHNVDARQSIRQTQLKAHRKSVLLAVEQPNLLCSLAQTIVTCTMHTAQCTMHGMLDTRTFVAGSRLFEILVLSVCNENKI